VTVQFADISFSIYKSGRKMNWHNMECFSEFEVKKLGFLLLPLLLVSCTNFSAKQPYRTEDGEQLLISANMPNGVLKLWVNETLIVNEPFVNQDKSFAAALNNDFTNVYLTTYQNKKVMARCKRETHAFSSPEHECDVFINGEYAANLFLH